MGVRNRRLQEGVEVGPVRAAQSPPLRPGRASRRPGGGFARALFWCVLILVLIAGSVWFVVNHFRVLVTVLILALLLGPFIMPFLLPEDYGRKG
jgi:hypothetical protein